ncbi:conserved Plasmodium protein, unknown function [Plasmodium gallinaceum]|uniref:Uncharacterized protein n=1 Tax=Plasmodium gallinaceum TaxID=5849 RepID=A0A1J1GL14_PLAGA|nr:conserved Plasmodium protein, unknown function [Plasmodium gallinaceum]CRG93011.1 conserved Plasmodium protein, unknown function [Plasmodium gallinaceum]
MNDIPHIIVLSHNKGNVKSFLEHLKDKFEFLEYYENSDYYRITFDHKNINTENNYFIFKNEAKIRIINKYYSADVIISSCIVKTKKKKDHEEKESEVDIKIEKEIDVKKILYECIIFLFDNFSKEEKILINENPFRNYDDDCVEYIKDSLNGKMIKNENFDFSNLYKDIGIKIAIFPLSLQECNNEIINFFSEYFIECLYINYELETLNKNIEQKSSKIYFCDKLKEKKRNIHEDYYEEDNERLVEALHCHMWKNLEIKKKNTITHNLVDIENKIDKIKEDTDNGKDMKENRNDIDDENIKNDRIIKSKDNIKNNNNINNIGEIKYDENVKNDRIIKNKDNIKNNNNINNIGEIKYDENVKKENNVNDEKNINNNDKGEDKNTDLFLQNFNQIIEKIRLVKQENKNCSDSVRRKKAEELIFELQKYFCDIDDE